MSEGAKSNFNGNGLRIKQKKPKNREKTRKKQTRKERKKVTQLQTNIHQKGNEPNSSL